MTANEPLYQDTFPPEGKLRHVLMEWTGAHVLDLGANTGALGPYVLTRGAASYRGVEANAEWAAAGVARYGGMQGWSLVQGNARDADLTCDVLCCLGLFHHLRDDDVRHILGHTSASRVLIEQPVGGKFKNYRMRAEAWYRAELEEAGFGAVEAFAYGFAYPVPRPILLATRGAGVTTEPTRRTVDLRTHPEYWAAIAPRPGAIAELVLHDDPTEYLAWYRSRQPNATDAHADARVAYMRTMIAEIRANGYDAHRWRTDPRGYDGRDGNGPITVRPRPSGGVTPWDGAHRACVLHALGLPVTAEVVP
jgi:hypothetical protein